QPRGMATTYVGLFSPLRASYTLTFPNGSLVSETRGFDDPPGRPAAVLASDGHIQISDVLVDVASVRTLVAETPIDLDLLVASRLTRDGNGQIVGEVRNLSGLPFDSALVVRGTSFQELGSLVPGASAMIDLSSAPRTFPWGVTLPESGIFNRRQFFNSLFSSDALRFSSPSASGGVIDTEGVYLLAWAERPVISVAVNGGQPPQNGLTLYIIRLHEG
ncbi:MAG TPA: hypothetical protein PKC19_08095, partial [Roseiflexaceae bacterium]|nr:hypothetical protein [Roseiflexaceae bacterium]